MGFFFHPILKISDNLPLTVYFTDGNTQSTVNELNSLFSNIYAFEKTYFL
jgi:hypothetical protein